MEELRAWMRQPTTVAGISALIATASALLMGQIAWSQAVPILVGSAVSMLLPDNTGAHEQAQQLASEIISKLASKKETPQ